MKTKYKALDYKRKLENKSEKYNVLEETVPDNMSTEDIVLDKENSLEIINIINSFKEPDKTYFILGILCIIKLKKLQ